MVAALTGYSHTHMDAKRLGETKMKQNEANQNFGDEPISPFRLFMYILFSASIFLAQCCWFWTYGSAREEFMKKYKSKNGIEKDRKGFETWKNMSKEERQPYVLQAHKVDSCFQEALDKEAKDMIKVQDDEADSSAVGDVDEIQWIYGEFSESSEYYTSYSEFSSNISKHFCNSSQPSSSQT